MQNQNDFPFQPTIDDRAITDRELLIAYQLVTEIHEYENYNQQLVKSSSLLLSKTHKLPVRFESPLSLLFLQSRGWSLYMASHWGNAPIGLVNGYQGIVLVHNVRRLVLLVHRGMQLEISNMANCLQIGNQQLPKIVDDALAMCDIAVNHANELGYELYHSGFSKGGFLAQITATHCNHFYQRNNRAICYDPPGASFAMDQLRLSDNRQNVFIYVTSPNPVNTAGLHYGHVRQLASQQNINSYQDELKEIAVNKKHIFNFNFLLNENNTHMLQAVMKSHDYRIFINALGNDEYLSFYHVRSWPQATNTLLTCSEKIDSLYYSSKASGWQESLFAFGCDVANNVAAMKSMEVTKFAEIPDINAIEHQILNPNIRYHHEAILAETHQQLNQTQATILVVFVFVVMIIIYQQIQAQQLSSSSSNNNSSPSYQPQSNWTPQNMQQRGAPVLNLQSTQTSNLRDETEHDGNEPPRSPPQNSS